MIKKEVQLFYVICNNLYGGKLMKKRCRRSMAVVISAVFMISMLSVTTQAAGTYTQADTLTDGQEIQEPIFSGDGQYVLTVASKAQKNKVVDNYLNGDEEKFSVDSSKTQILSLKLNQKEVNYLKNISGITLEPNIILKGTSEEDTNIKSELPKQWYLDAISYRKSYSHINHPGSGIKVELIDSGVSYTDDIDVEARINLIPGEEDISVVNDDGSGHGTAMAGIMAAKDNGIGITGISPDIKLFSIKVLNGDNQSTLDRVIQGIYWGIENHVNIINLSLGTSTDSEALHQAVQAASNAGILLIAAAGNEDTDNVLYPAAYPEVLSVGAVKSDGKIIDDFVSSDDIEIYAPGSQIETTGLFDGILSMEGTSASTAEVTAAAATLWSRNPDQTSDFIRSLLIDTGKNMPGITGKTVDISNASENYDKYVSIYKNHDKNKNFSVQNTEKIYDTTGIINGLWTRDKHADIVDKYLEDSIKNSGTDAADKITSHRIQILASTVKWADTQYGSVNQSPGSTLHGTGNYLKGLRYLYYMAAYMRRNGETDSIQEASDRAYQRINVRAGDNETALKNLKTYTESLLRDNYDGGGDKNKVGDRYFRVLGFGLHCAQDTFAHRAIIQTEDFTDYAVLWKKTDFNKYDKNGKILGEDNLVKLKNDVMVQRDIEYRKIKYYTLNHNTKDYEDNPMLKPNRLKDAKRISKKFMLASLNKTGYDPEWFENPDYKTILGTREKHQDGTYGYYYQSE